MLVRVVGLLIQALSCEFFILLNHNKVDNDVLASLSIWSYLLSYLVLLDMFLWLPISNEFQIKYLLGTIGCSSVNLASL